MNGYKNSNGILCNSIEECREGLGKQSMLYNTGKHDEDGNPIF